MFGFLLGATTAGAGMYYYVIDEYRVANELLTEDIYVRPLSRPPITANSYPGPAVCRATDRKLREDARREGRCAEEVKDDARIPRTKSNTREGTLRICRTGTRMSPW